MHLQVASCLFMPSFNRHCLVIQFFLTHKVVLSISQSKRLSYFYQSVFVSLKENMNRTKFGGVGEGPKIVVWLAIEVNHLT